MTLHERKLSPEVTAFYRPGTSDEKVLEEVIYHSPYRLKKIGFQVTPGERWLDLGANIGAFALYCKLHGATAVCYEPDYDCFDVLMQNVPEFDLHNSAVTASREPKLRFWKGKSPTDFYRATAIVKEGSTLPPHPLGELPNTYGGFLREQYFDGVKMDIEGSEGPLLDEGLVPNCEKLCIEYHLSRDGSPENLKRRVELLERHFKVVHYTSDYKQMMEDGFRSTWRDKVIYCVGRR